MKRRNCLIAFAGAATLTAQPAALPMQLHVDLTVDMAKEKELLDNFKTIFKPTISRQQGFVDVKLMKLSKAAVGKSPGDANYRLLISFQTEALRTKWVASDDHQRVWPKIAGTLKHDKLNAIVYDIVA